MSQHLGRPSFANNAAAAVLAKAADFAPTPAGPGSRLGFASPGVHSRLPEGGTVTQRRTVGRTVGRVYEDDDFRYNEAGATATTRARGPTFTLGSVVLCALVAAAVALGTGLSSLASPAGADARALASRVTSVSASLDAMAKALAADAKSAAKPAKLDKPAARELASLREEVRALAEAQARSGTGALGTVDAKAFASLRQDLKTLVDEHYALAARAEDRVATAAFDCERKAATNARKTDALEDAFAAFARDTGDVKRDLERSFQTLSDETNRRIESWRGKPLVSKRDVELEVERALAAAAASNRVVDAANRVDYALFSGGGRVVGHSALSPLVARAEGPLTHALKSIRGGVHPRADEWVLSGGFNEPNAGECLALRGDRGHVDVRLREAVFVNAVTVEHVRGDVAYDLSSAPKVLAVLGWNRTREPPAFSEKGDMERSAKSLHDFTRGGEYLRYELKSSELSRGAAQTFAFHATRARAVDHVRFEVRSNYGNAEYTCLYRLRVHGAPVAKPAKVEYD